jgi:hypothetical protein
MKLQSRPRQAQKGSRRNFLTTVGTLPTALAALPRVAAAAQTLPQVKFGKHSISRLLCGSNTFGALSHLSEMINHEMRQYYTPEQIVKTLHRCQEAGINAAQGLRPQHYARFVEEGGRIQVFSNGQGDPARIEALAKTGCIGIHHFGVATDTLYKAGELSAVREYLKRVRDTGLLTGLCSHIPAVIETAESQGWDVDYYMTCVYQWGRTQEEFEKLFGDRKDLLPIEAYTMLAGDIYPEVFLSGDPPRMFKTVRQVKKPCLVYKILAAGRRAETPKTVEEAFQEAFENIKPTDAIIVGFYPRYMDHIAADAELVRRYGSNTALVSGAL